jgi:hypothetical protein
MSAHADKTMESANRLSPAEVAQILPRHWNAQIVGTAARLRIADHLAAGPRNLAELAEATGAHREALGRFLRACLTVGIVRERDRKGCPDDHVKSVTSERPPQPG